MSVASWTSETYDAPFFPNFTRETQYALVLLLSIAPSEGVEALGANFKCLWQDFIC